MNFTERIELLRAMSKCFMDCKEETMRIELVKMDVKMKTSLRQTSRQVACFTKYGSVSFVESCTYVHYMGNTERER